MRAEVLEYDTKKIVRIRGNKVGLINRLIQYVILGYVIGYVITYEKGYQSVDIGLSSVTTKLKGIALTNLSIQVPVKVDNKTVVDTLFDGPHKWDSSDYVIPPEEDMAVFVMTNMIITPRQQQGKCPEDEQHKDAHCIKDSDCVAGQEVVTGHGVMTGKCVKPDRPVHGKYNMCEIYAWCPVEYDHLPMPGTNFGKPLKNDSCLLEEAVNFTILIKNTVQFPSFDVKLRNIDEKQDKSYLARCNYDSRTHKLCPIFKLKTIFDEISDTAFLDVAIKGGVVAIKIKWDCDLDYAAEDCVPHYSFARIDNAHALIAGGYNFRFATYDVENKTQYRTLIKAYGIRFVILVDAKAGKFDIIPLLRNIGAGLALFGVATFITDRCLLYLLKNRDFYRAKKYQYVDDPDASDSATAFTDCCLLYLLKKYFYRAKKYQYVNDPDASDSHNEVCLQEFKDTPCPRLPKLEYRARQTNRKRQRHRLAEPTSLNFELDENRLPAEFHRADVRVRDRRHLIFATSEQLHQLTKATSWYIDGTFKLCRHPFSQLLTINAFVRKDNCAKQVPLLFVLMSGREKGDYRKVIKKVLELLPSEPSVTKVTLDFESALWNVLRQLLPDIKLMGCVFHWTQALWRKVQALGLEGAYSNECGTNTFIKKIMALPFLPKKEIPQMFATLQRQALTPQLHKFTLYVKSTWIDNVTWPPSSWSVYMQSIRTNNDVEGWHHRLNRCASGKTQLPLYLLINLLHKEACLTFIHCQLVSEKKLQRIQRKNLGNLRARIFTLWKEFNNKQYSAEELLEACSYYSGSIS